MTILYQNGVCFRKFMRSGRRFTPELLWLFFSLPLTVDMMLRNALTRLKEPPRPDASLRSALRSLEGFLQGRVMGVMDLRIEQRPLLRILQQIRHCRRHQIAIIFVFGRRIVKAAFGCVDVNAPQRQDKFLKAKTREAALFLAARNAGVLASGKASAISRSSALVVSTASEMTSRSCPESQCRGRLQNRLLP